MGIEYPPSDRVVVTGRTNAGKIGYARGLSRYPQKMLVWFPGEEFPRDVRAIHRKNLRPATALEVMLADTRA